MAWNKARYDKGYSEAGQVWTRNNNDIEVLLREYRSLLSVDEYEVGFRTYVQEVLERKSFIEAAKFVLESCAADYVLKTANRLVEQDKAEWRLDPEVDRVVGLVEKGPLSTNKAYMVVYLADSDFETGEDFETEGE